MRNFNVYTGTVGWEHADWNGGFYPDDLPEDWRLSFYNTQFRCAYLPYPVWHQASDAVVASWLRETQEDFHFVLGLPEKQSDDWARQTVRFGHRGKMEKGLEIVWIDPLTSLRELAGRIKQSSETSQNLYLIAKSDGLAQLRQIGELIEVMGV